MWCPSLCSSVWGKPNANIVEVGTTTSLACTGHPDHHHEEDEDDEDDDDHDDEDDDDHDDEGEAEEEHQTITTKLL